MIDRLLPTVLDLQHLRTALALWGLAILCLWLVCEGVGLLIDRWGDRLVRFPRDRE
jgi:hypothetical protein